MDDSSVIAEIHKLIDEKLATGVIVRVEWITLAILAQKADIEGPDAAFYKVCGFKVVSKMVKRAIGKYEPKGDTAAQLVLDGFRHLCKAYPITREGEVVLVPVNLCTDAELHDRAAQLDEMAKGCRAHARELREYVAARPKEMVA